MHIVLSRIHGSKRVSDTEETGISCFYFFESTYREKSSKSREVEWNQVSSPTIAFGVCTGEPVLRNRRADSGAEGKGIGRAMNGAN